MTENSRVYSLYSLKNEDLGSMRIRELQEIQYDERTATLKLSGLNPFKKHKSVRVVIDDPEMFLNAIKKALVDPDGKSMPLDPAEVQK